uniref:Uncharacterized protein n=1 Tax=Tanacetum cinerariifolium TaxID=118510 RepID=A0A6L2JW48_TANCI|nr:hypothetical protein [Tanacetum cinerariifolium]
MHKAFPLPGIEFPLAEEVPTASKEGCHCQKKKDATTRKIALLSKSRRNCQSKSNDSFTKVYVIFGLCCESVKERKIERKERKRLEEGVRRWNVSIKDENDMGKQDTCLICE